MLTVPPTPASATGPSATCSSRSHRAWSTPAGTDRRTEPQIERSL